MKVRFWGVRGAFAMTGREYLRYGGNTSAVELIAGGDRRLLIDLGTGVTELAKELMRGDFGRGQGQLPILLSHTHLDHIQGLPFFTPFFIKGNQICIKGAEPTGMSLEEILQNQINGHYSPLYGLENLAAGVTVEPVRPGDRFDINGFHVDTAALPHGNMWTLGYRVSAGGKAVAFLNDVEYPDGQPTEAALDLARDVDLLIHDAMWSDAEYDDRRGWGHSAVGHAVACAERAGAKKLALFYHSPDTTDAQLDAVVKAAQTGSRVDVFGAAEGPILDL